MALTNSPNDPEKRTIRVGSAYQANVLPDFVDEKTTAVDEETTVEEEEDREMENGCCLWKWHNSLADSELMSYCIDVNVNFGIEPDRALFILMNADYDFCRARVACSARQIFKQYFSEDDAYAFRNAFIYFGKKFAKIQQVLPHKSIGGLVEHYYLTKKQQDYKSFLDTKETFEQHLGDEKDESDDETTMSASKQFNSELHEPICEVCKEVVELVYLVNGLELCKTCKLYFRATNQHRPCPHPVDEPPQHVSKCPEDMRQITEEFAEMAKPFYKNASAKEEENGAKEEIEGEMEGREEEEETVCEAEIREMQKQQKLLQASCKRMQTEIETMKGATQNCCYKYTVDEALQFLAQTEPSTSASRGISPQRTSHSWTQREKEAVFHALVRFDGDQNAVAEIVPTKTSNMIRAFYLEHQSAIDEAIQKSLEKAERIGLLTVGNDNNNFVNGSAAVGGPNVEIVPELIELD